MILVMWRVMNFYHCHLSLLKNKKRSKDARIMHWALDSHDYNFDIAHRQDSLHSNVDELSRLHE